MQEKNPEAEARTDGSTAFRRVHFLFVPDISAPFGGVGAGGKLMPGA